MWAIGALLLVAIQPFTAWSAVIHGVVLERASSRPMARTEVELRRVAERDAVKVASMRTSSSGQFGFLQLPPGTYLVSASRRSYATTESRQRRPGGPGSYIVLGDAEQVYFTEIRLPKLGSVSGRLEDENGVGLPEVPVVAYPARLPLRAAATAKSDDRGIYRLYGLEPGPYWVRSLATQLEDGSGLLPTFAPGALSTRDAKTVEVALDSETTDIDFRPAFGLLFSLYGVVVCDGGYARIVLSSDTGRRETRAPCMGGYRFDQLAPNSYEVAAEMEGGSAATFEEIFLDQDKEMAIRLAPPPSVRLTFLDSSGRVIAPPTGNAKVRFRRRDLAGAGGFLGEFKGTVPPGYWEVFVDPRPGWYFEKFAPLIGGGRTSKAGPSPDAPEFFIGNSGRNALSITLGNRPAAVEGAVRERGEPVPGARVFALPAEAELRQLTHGVRETRSDEKGDFRIAGLSPGRYWIIASLDLDQVDPPILAAANVKIYDLKENAVEKLDLGLFPPR